MKTLHSKKKVQLKTFEFSKCPACHSEHLTKVDVDTICLDCDWDSTLMDVTSGNFEKRIAQAISQLPAEKPIRSKSKIRFVKDEKSPNKDETFQLPMAANE